MYRFEKFGWNWRCTFKDMQVSMLCEFGLKNENTYSRPFWGVIGVNMGETGNVFALLSL